MAETFDESRGQVSGFIRRLNTTQKILLVSVTVAALAAIVGLVNMVNRPSYGSLFSNLNPQDASKIVEKLKERSVPYALENEGKTILVPKQQIYDLRLALAGEGLPQSSVTGYEIFDRTNLGVSDFVQKINYRRALEGELARTILQLDEVEAVRVHIVVPEKALFKDDQKSPTASVVLKLKSGKPPKRESIQGIAHLVASSIEGMETNNITVVDSKGILLSDNTKSNSMSALSSTQYELQQKVETYLANKAQSLLEGVVGARNSLVQVNAELDFRQVERTLEQYDPENSVVRSEQITEEKGSSKDSLPPSTRTSNVTNYEVNKTIEHIVENVGAIKHLSVAALVNGKESSVERNGAKSTEYKPRSEDELSKFTDIVKRAVGFNALRNDEVSVVTLQFGSDTPKEDFLYKNSPATDWSDIAEKTLFVIAMIGGVVIVRSLLNKVRIRTRTEDYEVYGDPVVAAIRRQKVNIQLPPATEEISVEAQLRSQRRNRVSSYITEKPDEATRLLKVWLVED
jgi:flagellar M-ring protein FliF